MLHKLEAEDTTNLMPFAPYLRWILPLEEFAVRLFDILGYTNRDIFLRTWKDIELVICGVFMRAKTDVCLLKNRSEIILLVQQDKRQMEDRGDAEAQLIVEAIAAFQSNNKRRILAGLDPVQHLLIPGIVMIGTAPIFYKILFTMGLADGITYGFFPPLPTFVYFHAPAVPRPHRRLSEGMMPLDNRHIVLRYYEAFKRFIIVSLPIFHRIVFAK